MDRFNDKAKFSEKYANESGRPMWLAGSVLGNRCHVCAPGEPVLRAAQAVFANAARTARSETKNQPVGGFRSGPGLDTSQ
jgi:hypothetical protein